MYVKLVALFTAGVEHQNVEVVCAAINTFGSSKSSLMLAVQAEKPKISEENKVNDYVVEEEDETSGVVATRDSGNPGNSRQNLVGDKENIQLSEEGEIFWIPFHQPKSNQGSKQAEEEKLGNDLTTGVKAKEGGGFEKAEQADKVKALYQGENLAGHETKNETFEENLIKKENFDIKFAKLNSHAPILSLSLLVKSFIFMQSVLYFYFGTLL